MKSDLTGFKKFAVLVVVGVGIGLLLFYLMALMIKPSTDAIGERDTPPDIDFSMIRDEARTEMRDRTPPDEPEEPEDLPEPDMEVANQDDAPDRPDVQFDTPKMDVSASELGMGAAVGGGGQGFSSSGDSAPAPLVRVEPQYPRQAAMSGQEGWVRLEFDIDKLGDVTNVEILESEPRRTFDSAARQAVLRWKYRPQTVDGKPVVRENVRVQLDFELEN